MISLRRSALIWMTVLLTAVGTVSFAIAYETARREAAGFLDVQLRQIALNAGDGLSDAMPVPPQKSHDLEDDVIISIWNANGEPVSRAANDSALPRQTRPGFATVQAGGEGWRIYMAKDMRRTVQVAQRTSVRTEMAQTAALQAGLPVLAAIPLAWLVLGALLGKLLGRLSSLATAIAARGAESLDPIPVSGVPLEVLPMVEAMNGLIVRLHKAMDQQKRFVSDAAHELRTPLAALQIQVDNLRTPAAETSPQLAGLGAAVSRASGLVDQLLRIARLDGQTEQMPPVRVDLCQLLTQCVADFVLIAETKGIDMGIDTCDRAMISGWPGDLKTLFGNLVDNAIRYTPSGGKVDISVRQTGSVVTVEIIDTGCGIPPKDLPRLFDRFFRAAALDTDGSGLGLSIVDAVAKRHGLKVDIANRTDQPGILARVSGPAC